MELLQQTDFQILDIWQVVDVPQTYRSPKAGFVLLRTMHLLCQLSGHGTEDVINKLQGEGPATMSTNIYFELYLENLMFPTLPLQDNLLVAKGGSQNEPGSQ